LSASGQQGQPVHEPNEPSAIDLADEVAVLRARVAQLEQENRNLTIDAAAGPPLPQSVETHAPVSLFLLDQDGVITASQGIPLPSTDLAPQQIVGQSYFNVYADVPQLMACAQRSLAGDFCGAQVTLGHGVFEVYFTPVSHPGGESAGVSGLAIDVTSRIQAIDALNHQALHDPLTSLPNRALFLDRLDLAVATARRDQDSVALLLFDLDRFKEINDTFGHHYGDILLQQVSLRLMQALRDTDTVARLGGDEFAVLLPGNDQAAAVHVANVLISDFWEPFTVDRHKVRIGVSIGISCFPVDSHNAQTLLRHADVAMYLSKQAQHGPIVYAPDQDEHSPHRLALVDELREAIEENGLLLHFQPVADLRTQRVTDVEALVRWQHPVHGLLLPPRFVPMAESTGLMPLLSEWVLEAALRQRRRWQQAGLGLRVSVNLSMSSLHESRLVDTTQTLLRRYGVPATALKIEVTESALMRDAARTLEILRQLSDLGICLAIDDFGTGYSSLSYLKQLPVEEIKIDQSFVGGMVSDAADAAIVHSTIGLGHGLGLRVIAEGVETAATWDRLVALGCDGAQGYYISRPLLGDAIVTWVEQGVWKPA
jgi:diguanylate cyclase (GGDEF)-like protein